jgi:hypothetical protein
VSTRDFTPAQINDINNTGGISGTPLISTTPQAASLGTSGLILGAAGAGCLAQWAATKIASYVSTTADPATVASAVGGAVLVLDYKAATQRDEQKNQGVWQCIIKTIAKAVIDQITRSVVAWINSGFNGQPSFVTNFNQYFANVADQAAGEFIKGSALSFLCSPFAPQIKIAIAQSYANRNAAASCTLSKVINNINGFMNGGWGAGGWGGLIQFTTMPTNNPYGAYAYAQLGLNSTINNAQNNANRNVSPGGFISLQKCDNVPLVTGGVGSGGGSGTQPSTTNTNCKVTTPGAVIEQSLKKTLVDTPIEGLNLAQNIDDIVNALTNQIMLKALYGGLGAAGSITNPLAPAIDQTASAQAQTLLSQLQNFLGYAGQFASVEQGAIADIQNTQSGLNSLFNCWSTVASSSAFSASQQATAGSRAQAADTISASYDSQVNAYNDQITRANTTLGNIQALQSQVLFAATSADVQSTAVLISQSQGSFVSAADVTTAQQDRSTLQTQLSGRNQSITTELAQCRAATPQTL